MNSLIEQGIAKNLIRLEDGNKYIVYIHQNKRRSYTNPEEKVQAETELESAKQTVEKMILGEA
jgi:hypothetical protein